MESYDFDREIDRRGTNSLKYDFALERGHREDSLPLWVADMDFQAPRPVIDALHRAVEHGIFGYSEVKGAYYEALSAWFLKHFGWQTRPEWLVKTPGVVYALAMAIRALTKPGDGVLIQPPVYYPFFAVIRDNDRRVVESPLRYRDGAYETDFEDFERKIRSEQVKVFMLCSPHNPTGRVWTPGELAHMGEICRKYGVYVISDEIHCDFAFPENPHHIFTEVNPQLAEQTIICTAPSKTFNLAGLQVSNIWIPGEEVRRSFVREIDRTGYSQLNALGLAAGQAAYESGEQWLLQCKAYLRSNLDYLREYLRTRIPQIRLVEPQGTYFAWLDCSGLGLERGQLEELFADRARLWVDAGHIFGGNADQFQRLVLACTRATLKKALEQLEEAVRGL